jgi:hypothetical protein
MEPGEAEIDHLLRRSMAAPVPSLQRNFDQRLMGELRQDSRVRNRYRLILLTGYGLASVVASAVVMRGQGFGWGTITVMILVPLVLVATVPWAWRASQTTMRRHAR